MTHLKQLIHRKLAAILDETIGNDDPAFGGDQVDFLEKRFFEIQQDIEELSESVFMVPATELLETLCECVRILADYDADDGEEGQLYRRCLSVLTQLSRTKSQITRNFII